MSTNDSKKSAVPKFASFKPKSTPPETTLEASSKTGHDRQEDDPRRKHRHAHEAREDRTRHSSSRDHRHKRHRSRSVERNTSRIIPQPDAPRAKESNEESLFTVDRRGDPLIVRYGSNDRNRIPAYRRSGAGRLLGAPGRMTIIRDGPKEVFSLGGSREGTSAFRDRSYLARVLRTKPRQFKHRSIKEDVQSPGADDEFLPLKQSRKRKRGQGEPSSSSDEDQPSYRSIYGKPKDHEGSDSDLDDSSATSFDNEDENDAQDPIKARYIELARRVKDHPEDINSWLELARVQESVLRLGDGVDDHKSDGAKGLANVKLSLYEEALPHAPSDSDRERILLHLMREGSKVWSSKALAKRWAEVAEGNPTSFALWKGRLNFELTDLSTFTHDDLKQYHLNRLRSLKQLLMETTNVDETLISICHELIYVFLRTTRFLYETGFTELAVASWQAILEMTFARSTQAYTSVDGAMDSFRDFWESEVPRMGEENAKGWRHFAEAEAMADLPEPETDMAPRRPETRDVYKAWATLEVGQTRNGRMPARTLDEGTEDDPFRVVMYSDIEPLLFYVPSPALPSVNVVLLDAFLLFCGMPPIGVSDMIKAASNDPFVFHGGKAVEAELTNQITKAAHEPEDLSKKPPPFSHDGSHVAITPEVLFAGSHWFNYIVDWASLYPLNGGPLKYDWVVMTIRQVALTFGFIQAAEYSLALSWNRDHSSSKKTAKALLKKYPSSIPLYNGYALAEWENGNQEVARNVFISAAGLQSANQNEKQLLWNAWAWKELEAGNHERVLNCLVSSIEDAQSEGHSKAGLLGQPSSTQILKAKQSFLARRDYLLSSGDADHCSLFAESLALLEYLTAEGETEPKSKGQGNISVATRGVLAVSAELASRGFSAHIAHERLLQFCARLLYFHASHGPFRPIFLRETLLRFIAAFPQNAIFLTLFAWAESSLRIDDPVRDILRRTVLVESQDCLSSRLFAIHHEHRVGNAHSTRAAFESALESDACANNVALWISYIRFCYSRKELRHKAKDVFYRAIASCPWSKELAMEAFTTLAKIMESSELRAVFNTMTSKGLRIHVDLEEFSAKWSQSQRSHQIRTR